MAPQHSTRREYFRVQSTHLGDVIVSTNMIYNMSLQGRFISVVEYERSSLQRQLFRIFDYDGLVLPRAHGVRNLSHMPFCKMVRSTDFAWCCAKHISGTPESFFLSTFRHPKVLVLPKPHPKPLQACQFDSRSPKMKLHMRSVFR